MTIATLPKLPEYFKELRNFRDETRRGNVFFFNQLFDYDFSFDQNLREGKALKKIIARKSSSGYLLEGVAGGALEHH